LRSRPDEELGIQLQAKLRTVGIDPPLERATAAVILLKERATFVNDMLEGTYLFTSGSPLAGDEEARAELRKRWKPESAEAIKAYMSRLPQLDNFQSADLEKAFNEVLREHGMKLGQAMPLYRLFVAGRMQGPGMYEVSAFLGCDEVVRRLEAGLKMGMEWG
jgi:glutamyl-tRNA synthetase